MRRVALHALVILMSAAAAGCGGARAAPAAGRGAPAEQPAGRIIVFAAPVMQGVLERLAAEFEAAHPGVELALEFGRPDPGLDATDVLIRAMNAGAAVDLFAAEDPEQLKMLLRTPRSAAPWLSNELVLVTARGSRLRPVDLSTGTCPIAAALERTPLGRKTRLAMERRGIWSTMSGRVERFDSGGAVLERVRSGRRFGHALGVVYATDARDGRGITVLTGLRLPPGEAVVHTLVAWTAEGEALARWLREPAALKIAAESGFRPADGPGAAR